MNRVIKFRAKDKRGQWWFGTNEPCQNLLDDRVLRQYIPLSEFWLMYENDMFVRKTLGEYVEFLNDDGTKGGGFEDDIIDKGGDNHNSVITYGENSMASVGFYTKESKLKGEHYNRYHGLPPDAKTVKIIGNVVDDKKLKSRWGRS